MAYEGPIVPAVRGGTGQNSYTVGDILYADTTTTLAILNVGASGTVLHGGTTPSYSAVSLTADVSGILPSANGGTGINNGLSTITIGGSVTFSGAYTAGFTFTANTSVTFPASGTVITKDSNGNAHANNFESATQGHAATGTITLSAASAYYQVFSSGSGSCTVVLPDATTLQNGHALTLNNNATGTVTVQAYGTGTTLYTIPAGGYGGIYLQSNSFPAGQWDYHFSVPTNSSWGTAGALLPTSAYVNAGQFLLSGTSSGTVSILPQAAAGTYNFNLPTTAGTSGYLLTSAGGSTSPMTWSSVASIAVSSIAGTANQIAASASTGAVTLSLTNGISLGSYQATASPTGGLLMPGLLVIGATSWSSGVGAAQFDGTSTALDGSNNGFVFQISSTLAPTTNSTYLRGINTIPTFSIANSTTASRVDGFYVNPSINTNTSGTVQLVSGLYIDGMSLSGSGTFTQVVTAVFVTPASGTTRFGNQIIGNDVDGSPGCTYLFNCTGLITGNDGSSRECIEFYNTGMRPLNNNISTYGFFCAPTAWPHSTNTITSHIAIYALADVVYTGVSGRVTSSYSGYFAQPTNGNNKTALYADDMSIGFTATTPPSNGLIVSGPSIIGASSPASNTRFTVNASSTDLVISSITGTAAATGTNIVGFQNNPGISPAGTYAGFAQTIQPTFTSPSGGLSSVTGLYVGLACAGAGTIGSVWGIKIDPGSSSGTTVSSATALQIYSPGYAASNANYGIVLVGFDTAGNSTGCRYLEFQTGTITGDDGSDSIGFFQNMTIQPTNNNRSAYGLCIVPSLESYSTNTLSSCAGIYVQPVINAVTSGSTISAAYGMIINQLYNGSSAGTITNAYGLAIVVPIAAMSSGTLNYNNIGLVISGTDTVSHAYGGKYGFLMNGTFVGDDGSNQNGVLLDFTQTPTTSARYTNGFYCAPYVTPYSTNTISGAISGVFTLSGSVGSGAITAAQTVTIYSPTCGAASSYGLYVIGNDSSGASTGTRYLTYIAGTITADDTSSSLCLYVRTTLNPTNNHINTRGILVAPYALPYSTNAIDTHYAIAARAEGAIGSGSITSAISGYFYNPTVGTSKIALYADNLAVGTVSVPPPSGAIFAGVVQFGAAATGSTTALLATANCPAVTGTQPYVWIKCLSSDGSTVYVPGWK